MKTKPSQTLQVHSSGETLQIAANEAKIQALTHVCDPTNPTRWVKLDDGAQCLEEFRRNPSPNTVGYQWMPVATLIP
jgi:hypothetical protein